MTLLRRAMPMSLTQKLHQLIRTKGGLDELIAVYPRQGDRIREAYNFYKAGWPSGTDPQIVEQLIGIDFNFPIDTEHTLPAGTLLASFRHPKISAFKGRYFSHHADNATPTQNGVADRADLYTPHKGRVIPVMPKIRQKVRNLYEVVKAIPRGEALESISAPVVDTFSVANIPEITRGGATQIFIPNPHLYVTPRHDAKFALADLKAALREKHAANLE